MKQIWSISFVCCFVYFQINDKPICFCLHFDLKHFFFFFHFLSLFPFPQVTLQWLTLSDCTFFHRGKPLSLTVREHNLHEQVYIQRKPPLFFNFCFFLEYSWFTIHSIYIFKTLYSLIGKQTYNPIKKWGEDMSRHFSKEDMQMAKKYRKRCLTSLVISDIHSCHSSLQFAFVKCKSNLQQISPHIYKNCDYQFCVERTWKKREPLCTTSRNTN